MTQWIQTVTLTGNRLYQLVNPIANVWLQYTEVTHTATNHALTDFPYPTLNIMAVGANVLVLKQCAKMVLPPLLESNCLGIKQWNIRAGP